MVVSSAQLGNTATSRLSRGQPPLSAAGGMSGPLGTLEDAAKQQASTIHEQALKLQQLQGLLDFALKQKAEEDVEDEKRVRQLEEIIALKDRANRDLKDNVKHLENALAETKMNLEFMHSKWRDEAAAHEQVLEDMRGMTARMAVLEDENRRQKEREKEASARVAAARSDALDRVQELQELHMRHGSAITLHEKHKSVHAMIKERLGHRLLSLSWNGIKRLCFTHWLSRVDETRLKAQLVRALEKNWMSRRLLLWRHQRDTLSAQQTSAQMELNADDYEGKLAELVASRDAAVAQATTAEVALSEAREGLQKTMIHHADLVMQNETLATQMRAFQDRADRESELETELKKAQFELRVVEEELRLSQDLTQAVRVSEASAETEIAQIKAMQNRIDAACQELQLDDVAADDRLNMLIVLATRCWAAQRDRDAAIELRQSLARQVKDVTQQLALLEEENALLRNIGLASSLQGGPQGAPVGAEQNGVINKDEAIAVLTRRARQLERKLEAVTSDMHHAMGQLIVTVVRARDLPMEGSTLPGQAVDPYVKVKVDRQEYKTQVRKGTGEPEWNEDFAFSVSASTKDLALTLVDWCGGRSERTLASAIVQLSDLSFVLDQPHHAWVPLQRITHSEDDDSYRGMLGDMSEGSGDRTTLSMESFRDMSAGAVLLEIEYKGPAVATPRGQHPPAVSALLNAA